MTKNRNTSGGLLIYEERWKKEGAIWRRFFPQLFATAGYIFKGLYKDPKQRKFINDFLAKEKAPMFRLVELETQNRCNGTCEFCGVNRNAPQRPYARMSEELYESILGQLEKMHYKGGFSLHSNNEPLLDKRLPDFALEARARLPEASIKMFTNGTLLTLDMFRTLMPSFDRIFVNNYAKNGEMLPNIREIHDFCLTPEGEKLLEGRTLIIQMRDPSVILSSRGGSAPNRDAPTQPIRALCAYPYTQFIIRPDGCVSLCCNDALGKVTLGDLKEQTMRQVWRGKKATAIRKSLAEKGRAGVPLCAVCDFVK